MTSLKQALEKKAEALAAVAAGGLVAVGDPENGYEQDFEFNEEQFEDFKSGFTAALELLLPVVLAAEDEVRCMQTEPDATASVEALERRLRDLRLKLNEGEG